MEILFESTYKRTKELFKELYFFCYFKRPLWIWIHILTILNVLMTIVSFLLTGEVIRISWGYLLFYVFFLFVRYRGMVTVPYNREEELSGDNSWEYTTVVMENKLIQKCSNGSSVEIEYGKVRRILETKSYFLFLTKSNMFFIFCKDSFTIGEEDRFIEFFKNKGYKIKNKKKSDK